MTKCQCVYNHPHSVISASWSVPQKPEMRPRKRTSSSSKPWKSSTRRQTLFTRNLQRRADRHPELASSQPQLSGRTVPSPPEWGFLLNLGWDPQKGRPGYSPTSLAISCRTLPWKSEWVGGTSSGREAHGLLEWVSELNDWSSSAIDWIEWLAELND